LRRKNRLKQTTANLEEGKYLKAIILLLFGMPDTMKKISYFMLILICLFFSYNVFAADRGIVISGGDPNRDISNWRERMADKFTELIRGRGVSNINEPRSKNAVKQAILGLKGNVSCGDNVIIYFNGHGTSSGGLRVTRSGGTTETISTRDMLKWLKEAELPCCCKIHLVIHACYSGKFIKEMMLGNPHVITATSSSKEGKKAHRDMKLQNGAYTFPGNDWPTGFNEDLAAVKSGLGWQETIQESKKSAIQKMKSKYKNDDPQTWKRFSGHVEKVTLKKKNGPKEVALKDTDKKTHTVTLKPGSKLKVGEMKIKYCELKASSQMTAAVRETDTGSYTVEGNPDVILNIKDAWGHVQAVDRVNNTITVHFEAPAFLRCKTIELRMKDKKKVPDWVKRCKWIKIDDGHFASPAGIGKDDYTVEGYKFGKIKRLWAHVKAADRNKRTITIEFIDPVTKKLRTVTLKMGKGKQIPDWMVPCKWFTINRGEIRDTPKIGALSERPAPELRLEGHVGGVSADRREMTVHLYLPRWLECNTIKVKLKQGVTMPSWVKKCKWIRFKGYLKDENITDASGITELRPKSLTYTGHVRAVDTREGTITVHISDPKWLFCEVKKLRLDSSEIPGWVRPCRWITFQGPLTDGDINPQSFGRIRGEEVKIRRAHPVKIAFRGTVERVGRDWIEVRIIEPKSATGKVKRVNIKPGTGGIPAGVKKGDTVTFPGYIENDIIKAPGTSRRRTISRHRRAQFSIYAGNFVPDDRIALFASSDTLINEMVYSDPNFMEFFPEGIMISDQFSDFSAEQKPIFGARLAYELTRRIGIEGSFGYGQIPGEFRFEYIDPMAMEFSDSASMETMTGLVKADMDLLCYNANLALNLFTGRFQPFVTGGVGGINYTTSKLTGEIADIAFEMEEGPSRNQLTYNFGGGLKLWLLNSIALRAEARYYISQLEGNAPGTEVQVEEDVRHLEVSGGLSVRF